MLAPVDPADRAVREEIFGPVACVIPFRDEAEAIALANDTIYGLSGSIWTRDGARALRVARAIEAGVLSINSNTSVRNGTTTATGPKISSRTARSPASTGASTVGGNQNPGPSGAEPRTATGAPSGT